MRTTRRTMIVGMASSAALPALPAWGQTEASPFTIDWQGGPQTPAVAQSLAAQITLVEGLTIKPEIAAFFAAQVLTVDLASDTHTRAGPRGVFFERRAVPHDNPVLLHELLHRYQLLRMPGGIDNADVHRFYDQAKASRLYPARSYMLTDAFEFFAMMASVVLYGKAARPPRTRANVAAKSPDIYAWVVREFGLIA